ncbi:MAG: hypothetical protein WAJ92_16275 [Candidatus Acidiferrales bacterium]
MSKRQVIVALLAVLGFSWGMASPSVRADGIEYQATQASGDTWQYTYTLTGAPLGVNQAFTVFFDPTLTSNLADTSLDATDPASSAAENWLSFTIPFDPSLNSDGFYSALALVNDDSMTEAFTLTFAYSGLGQPGSQMFSIDQFDSFGNLVMNLQTGETTPVGVTTPEPSAGVLLIVGIAGILAGIYCKRRLHMGAPEKQLATMP